MSVAEKLTAIADRIRSHTKKTDKLTLDGMASGVQEVYEYGWSGGYGEGLDHGVVQGIEEGLQNAYDKFWDNFQLNGTRTNYVYSFGCGWNADIFKPKYPMRPVSANYMFFNNIEDGIVTADFVEFCTEHNIVLDFSDCQTAVYALAKINSPHIGVLDFSKCTKLGYLFYAHNGRKDRSVQKIDEFISSEITAFENSTFQTAIYLEDITMSGVVSKSINFGTCPLNKASIISVVNVLSSSTTGQTVTFKKTAVNTAFGINVDDASTYPVGSEFYNLRNSKSNWTFSYA